MYEVFFFTPFVVLLVCICSQPPTSTGSSVYVTCKNVEPSHLSAKEVSTLYRFALASFQGESLLHYHISLWRTVFDRCSTRRPVRGPEISIRRVVKRWELLRHIQTSTPYPQTSKIMAWCGATTVETEAVPNMGVWVRPHVIHTSVSEHSFWCDSNAQILYP